MKRKQTRQQTPSVAVLFVLNISNFTRNTATKSWCIHKFFLGTSSNIKKHSIFRSEFIRIFISTISDIHSRQVWCSLYIIITNLVNELAGLSSSSTSWVRTAFAITTSCRWKNGSTKIWSCSRRTKRRATICLIGSRYVRNKFSLIFY